MIKTLCLSLSLILLSLTACSKTKSDITFAKDWPELSRQLAQVYKDFEFPAPQLSYQQNLDAIEALDELKHQEFLLNKIHAHLETLDTNRLNHAQKLDYELLTYDIQLQLIRNNLAQNWRSSPQQEISDKGIYQQNNGKQWYRYYLKRWVDLSVEPQSIFALGELEISKVKSKIKAIQLQLDLPNNEFALYIKEDDKFFATVEQTKDAFEKAHTAMSKKLADYFPNMNDIPTVKIQQGDNERLAHVPGFYNNDTLYFNFFDTQYKKRQVEWLYLHEAIPGHHYQLSLASQIKQSDLRHLLSRNSGYIEGWAAYVEDLAIETASYSSVMSELGKWEWDLVRSVRVPLDVGLNYYGWDEAKALAYWQSHITGRDDIGRREIARMLRWPAQVVTYKYGAVKIMKWLKLAKDNEAFSYKAFHQKLLERGALPLSIIEKEID